MPGLTDWFAAGVITVSHRIEDKAVQLACIDASLLIENVLTGEDVDDSSKNAQTVRLFLHFHSFTFERHGILRDNRCVDMFALHRMQVRTLELIRNAIPGHRAQIIGFAKRLY